MENGSCIVDFPIKMEIFHSYVTVYQAGYVGLQKRIQHRPKNPGLFVRSTKSTNGRPRGNAIVASSIGALKDQDIKGKGSNQSRFPIKVSNQGFQSMGVPNEQLIHLYYFILTGA